MDAGLNILLRVIVSKSRIYRDMGQSQIKIGSGITNIYDENVLSEIWDTFVTFI